MWLPAIYFRTLRRHIDDFRENVGVWTSLENEILNTNLKAWNVTHCLIYEAVQWLNRCFSFIFLVNLTYFYFAPLNIFLYVFRFIMDGKPLVHSFFSLLFVIPSLLEMWLLAYSAERIVAEVTTTPKG